MPDFRLRKMMLFSETIHHENGPPPANPRRRGAIVAIVANPFAGTWQADLRSSMDVLKPLGLEMTDELIDALGGVDSIDGYGKAALAGEGGELEHTALWHVPGGYSMRERLGEAKAEEPARVRPVRWQSCRDDRPHRRHGRRRPRGARAVRRRHPTLPAGAEAVGLVHPDPRQPHADPRHAGL